MSESYHHDVLVPSPAACKCPSSGCDKLGTQCVEVSKQVRLDPSNTLGTAVITCQGNPTVSCETDASGFSCTVTVTQQICVSIPVTYGINIVEGDDLIACGGDSVGGEDDSSTF